MTFLPAYLRGLGMSGREISTVFTVTPLLALVVPLGWAYLADHTPPPRPVLRVVVGGAWLGFVPMLFARRFPVIFAAWALYALFSVAVGGWRTPSPSRACGPARSTGACGCGAPSGT
jgi:cyanate permease